MKAKVVDGIITTNSAGQVVESVPVFFNDFPLEGHAEVVLETDDVGGVPVRIVDELTVENSAGNPVNALIVVEDAVEAMTFDQAWATEDYPTIRKWFQLNTGPRVELTDVLVGDQTITTQGQADALVGKMIRGKVLIDANNLELQDFGVEWDGSGTGATLLQVLNGRTGVSVHHFLLDGKNGNISYGLSGTTYSTGLLCTNGEIKRMGGDGIRLFKNSTYRHMYVHSFRPWDEAVDGVFDPNGSQSLFPHTDALQVMRTGNLVEECFIENTDADNATGALTLIPDTDEAIAAFTMQKCYVDGGGNVLYVDNQNADIDNPGANGQPSGLVFNDLLIGRNFRGDVWRHREVPSANFTKTNVRYADTGLPVEDHFIDDFNRANENVEASAAKWTRVSGVAGALAIDTNRVRINNITQSTYLVEASKPISLTDHYVEADWRSTASSSGWLIARYVDESNYVGMQINALKPALYTKINNVFTQVSAPDNVAAGDKIRIECEGQEIRLYHKGILRVTRTLDPGVLTSGRVGMQARTTLSSAMLDNFAAGTLTP
jgi:hypothetical protein